MSPKLIPWLQKVFWILGWSVLILAVGNVVSEAFYFFFPPEISFLGQKIDVVREHQFLFLKQVRILFSSVGQAFFAFLVSAVFDMIFHRAPVGSQRTESFLILTCIGFVGEGVFELASWVQAGFYILPQTDLFSSLGIISLSSYLLSLLSPLICFVYAITIYVLYGHFSKMVTFESEVV